MLMDPVVKNIGSRDMHFVSGGISWWTKASADDSIWNTDW